MASNPIPRAYIACLASYNAGILHGDWIDLDGTEDIGERIAQILANSPIPDAEEWAIHDHENCGSLSEYAGSNALKAIEEAYAYACKHSVDWPPLIEYCDHRGDVLEPHSVDSFQQAFAGAAGDLTDWCNNFLDETGEFDRIPGHLRPYFNTEAFADAMQMSGDVFTIDHDHQTLVFWNH